MKATVDAYDGSVKLYAWDDEDPILQTWQKIFPSTLEPMSEMSGELMSHVRYPADLFKMQRAMLGRYHVTDAGSFYSRDDAWTTPNDPTRRREHQLLQPPYYLTMQMPGQDAPAFTLYSTFIPEASGDQSRNVLRGYLAVDADAGAPTANAPTATASSAAHPARRRQRARPRPGEQSQLAVAVARPPSVAPALKLQR